MDPAAKAASTNAKHERHEGKAAMTRAISIAANVRDAVDDPQPVAASRARTTFAFWRVVE
jgi:hypothetical protein